MFHCYKKINNQKNAKGVVFILDSLQWRVQLYLNMWCLFKYIDLSLKSTFKIILTYLNKIVLPDIFVI